MPSARIGGSTAAVAVPLSRGVIGVPVISAAVLPMIVYSLSLNTEYATSPVLWATDIAGAVCVMPEMPVCRLVTRKTAPLASSRR